MNDNSEVFWDGNEARYKAFFENSADGFLITVPDGNILAASPSACAMFQMTEAEILKAGRFGVSDITDPNLLLLIEERRKNGKAHGELTLLRKDGSKFRVEITSTIFLDTDGQQRTSMIIRDISERKKAAEALQASSEQLQKTLNELQKIMDASLDIICSINRKGEFESTSAAIEKILGYTPAEVIGKHYTEFIFPADIEAAKNMAAKLFEGNVCIRFENRYYHKLGHLVPLIWSSTWHEKDQLLYCTAKDATEKHAYESSLEHEKKRIVDIFEQAPSCIGVLKGPDHIYHMVNPFYYKLVGKKDIIGKSVREVLPEDDGQQIVKILDEVFKSGKSYNASEIPVNIDINGNGVLTTLYLNFVYQAYKDYKGVTEGIYFFIVDVTEQVVSRKKIEENERRFKTLIEKSKDVIALTNNTGALIYITASFTNILGYCDEACLSKTFFEFIHPKDQPVFLNNFQSLEAAPGKSFNAQFRMLHKSGQEMWCEGAVTNMLHEPGINAMVFNFRDISELKIKEEEREKMVRHLMHHSKNLEQFSYIISHNLRGPVANILGLANVLQTEISEYDRKQTETFLFSAVHNMDATLKDLNKILNVKSELAETKEVVLFSKILMDVSSAIENVIVSSGAIIQSDFSEVQEINTIKSFLHSIFYNLILNSIKYRNANQTPVIEIRSERYDKGVKLEFKDNGAGIDLTMHGDKIFGLYKRFHLNIEGRGLGLFMIKTQVESLGGKISVQSEVGKGAQFIVEFPTK